MNTTRSFVTRAALGATLVVGLAAVTAATRSTPYGAAIFGGPWISIETPVNPYVSSTTRRTVPRAHVRPSESRRPAGVRAREGLVDGKRRTVPFTLTRTPQTGTYVARREWGDEGIWTVLVTAMPEAKNGWAIQAVVNVGADGEVEKVTVPRAGQGPRLLTDADVERGLRDRAKAMLAVSAR